MSELVSKMERLQTDLTQYLLSDEGLTEVVMVQVRPRSALEATGFKSKLDRAVAGLEQRNGKRGMTLFVGMPVLRGVNTNLRAVHGELVVLINVVEKIVVNMGAGGTGMSAELVAERVAAVLQHHSFEPGQPLIIDGEAIRPKPEGVLDGSVEYEVAVRVPFFLGAPEKAARPSVSIEAGALTMESATEGAHIYFTLDGSLPGPGNPDALLYTAPYTPPGAGPWEVRAAAWAEGMAGSYELRATLEAEAVPGPEEGPDEED
jgi:hypothetical protein